MVRTAGLRYAAPAVLVLQYPHGRVHEFPAHDASGGELAACDGEHAIGTRGDLVPDAGGKVRYLGLSEVTVKTLRAAHAVRPINMVQQEYSMLSREPEVELLEAMRELGAGLVAHSPLGLGPLRGAYRKSAAGGQGISLVD
jgi:hypothetical protein